MQQIRQEFELVLSISLSALITVMLPIHPLWVVKKKKKAILIQISVLLFTVTTRIFCVPVYVIIRKDDRFDVTSLPNLMKIFFFFYFPGTV